MATTKTKAIAPTGHPAQQMGLDPAPRPDTSLTKSMPPGVLLTIPLLASLSLEQAQALARHGVKRRYKRGDLVVAQGEFNHALFILLDGRAHVLRTDAQGREVILDVVRPGEHIGEMSLIDNLPHSASVRCEQVCDVMILDGSLLAMHLPNQPELTQALMRSLVKRLRRAHWHIATLALYDVPERLMRCLIDLSEPGPNGDRQVNNKVSRQELAKMIGASREMVSRVMRELEQQGLICPRLDGGLLLPQRPASIGPKVAIPYNAA